LIIVSDKEQEVCAEQQRVCPEQMDPKLHSTLDVGGERITGLLTYIRDQVR